MNGQNKSLKLVTLVGSMRLHGNTEHVARLMEKYLARNAKESGISMTIEHIELGWIEIKTCLGCRNCFDRGENFCPLKDDLAAIRDRILQADAILLAAPVYVEDVSGLMKNLIDRLAYFCHRPALAGKLVYLLTTSGSGATSHSLHTMSRAVGAWGGKVIGQRNFVCGAKLSEEKAELHHGERLMKEAGKVFRALRQTSFKASFFSLLMFSIQQRLWRKADAEASAFDYRYWKENGWLDRGRVYYIEQKSSVFKTYAARGLGTVLSLLLFH